MVSIESYFAFAVFLAEVVQEEKSDKLTNFCSIEAARRTYCCGFSQSRRSRCQIKVISGSA